MSFPSSSLFFTSDIQLIKSCIERAADCSESKSLAKIGRQESKELVRDHVVRGFEQTLADLSCKGHWKDDRDHVLVKAHCWMFLSWMHTSMKFRGVTLTATFTPLSTTFYLETVRCLELQNLTVKCLCQVRSEVMEVLTDEIVKYSTAHCDEEDAELLLQFVDQCLEQMEPTLFHDIYTSDRLLNVLSVFTSGVKQKSLQLKMLRKLAEESNKCFLDLKQEKENMNYDEAECDSSTCSASFFTEECNVIEFEVKMKQFMSDVNMIRGQHPPVIQAKSFQPKSVCGLVSQNQGSESGSKHRYNTLKCMFHLICLIHQLVTCEWKSLFCWKPDNHGIPVIESVTQADCHPVLFSIFITCLSLQRHIEYDEKERKKLQVLEGILGPYFESQATSKERAVIQKCMDDGRIQEASNKPTDHENKGQNEAIDRSLEDTILRIQENLLGDEECFQRLLMAEELYQDERWLECVLANARKYLSTDMLKMLLDVLCVLHETGIPQDDHTAKVFKSLKQVLLHLLPCLSLQEQAEVIVYNFDLTHVYFESYTDQSLLLCDDSTTGMKETNQLLTLALNKIVNKSGEGFSTEVLSGIVKGALIAPYMTLKAILAEAVKHAGSEKVICKLLQTMPWFAGLRCAEHGYLLLRALNEILPELTSKKQEGQYLNLAEALMKPYVHPELRTKEPPLLPARELLVELIQPLLSKEDDIVSRTFVLDVFLRTLSCGQTSSSKHHWILDQEPLEMLLQLLEMYQDCTHFWADWLSEESGDEAMEREDFALDEAWTELNKIAKILEENLIPLLAEASSQEPDTFASRSVFMQDQLNQLDWHATILILPLLRNDAINCRIKMPEPLVHLVESQLHVEPQTDTDHLGSFWMVYFQSCGLSNEVFGLYLARLKDEHPKESNDDCDIEEVIEAFACILPFATWLQWERILNMAQELFKYEYLNLKEENWTDDHVELPDILHSDRSCSCVVQMSVLLMSTLRRISIKHWATPYVWRITLKNFVSKIKQLSLIARKEDEFVVTCHVLAHLSYITFSIIPENFQEHVAIVMLDMLNTCLLAIQDTGGENSRYLLGITDTLPHGELRTTMMNKIHKAVPHAENK